MKLFYRASLILFSCLSLFESQSLQAQSDQVNVFLGSSGDHGQLSPAASSPFSQLSILPKTNPGTHTGYEHLAKEVYGFTHNRFEGVGCQGSGGLLLLKPFLGTKDDGKPLIKVSEQAKPGEYTIRFTNKISTQITVHQNFGLSEYTFPEGAKGFRLDLRHTFNHAFVAEEHQMEGSMVTGWIQANTTCHAGIYKIYYAMDLGGSAQWETESTHVLVAQLPSNTRQCQVRVAFSAVDVTSAKQRLLNQKSLAEVRKQSQSLWNDYLGTIQVQGPKDRQSLFYSLLYRTIQSPFLISEEDGRFRGTDGHLHESTGKRYHGWAIWDNYKTQLPLLSVLYPTLYQDITSSVSNLYRYGKYDFAGPNEPANSVRTEHAAVVLLDAAKKGYEIDFKAIRDSLISDTARFDFGKPDKYLEAAFDMWTMGKLFDHFGEKDKARHFLKRSQSYKPVWEREFKDLSKNDVDRMSARRMYQGTIRQYRWAMPFDMTGLVTLAGGKTAFTEQLDEFFDGYYFNRANEPDLQSPTLYYASEKPWKYQQLVHQLAVDTVVQYYFNDNSRGIGAHIDRIYKNEPKAFVRTMDDDAGAMSGWFVLTALGIQQPLVGEPIYYLNVPLFEKISIRQPKGKLEISVTHFSDKNRYIQRVTLNGKDLKRVWLTHQEIMAGGKLVIEATAQPSTYGADSMWVSEGN
ncbi:glycoside hydrolase domain-containing protein [Siphonobacter sp. SORGH_AS_0500]|uniref:glycoside hydrolase domain-containing protein n=1 Tax=Siphonobacter sp. SORGH_AS_0500 TaxID=1864824 RepID=UPI00285E95FE|nr:glycoside hydrolase domain-containing protein [Siphonobacter sp. SORGH_AS_0500]MDR6197755.1 putative alpha-1,2-mannosidase [Siphonobacter sp. SORGH_AS_0500]